MSDCCSYDYQDDDFAADMHDITTDYLTLEELLDRVRAWGAQPEELRLPRVERRNGDWLTLRFTTCVDIGEYVKTWVIGRTPTDLWLQFIQRAPV